MMIGKMKGQLLFYFLLFSVILGAQTEKGIIYTSGGVGFTRVNPQQTSVSNSILMMELKGGYFFMDKVCGGLDISILNQEFDQQFTRTNTISAFGRYYLDFMYWEAAYGFGGTTTDQDKTNISQLKFGPGVPIFIGDYAALEAVFNYILNFSEGRSLADVYMLELRFALYL